MATKSKKLAPAKPSAAAVIKWTDDEWEMIAKRLYASMGPSLMTSEHLDEVKAKDVFLAQESALPESRHRKLISISQGFQAVRLKLKAILVKAAALRQKQLFDAEPGKAERGQGNAGRGSKNTSSHSPVDEQTRTPEAKAAIADVSPKKIARNAKVRPSDEQRVNAATDQTRDLNAGPPSLAENKPGDATVESPIPNPAAKESGEKQRAPRAPHHATPIADPCPPAEQSRPLQRSPAPVANDLNEIVRPFIAMVCQELVQALVDAASKPANREVLSAVVRQALLHTDAAGLAQARNNHQATRNTSQHRPASHQAPSVAMREANNGMHSATHEEDDNDAENDVQPLFDPKLPPSANSSFKPTVGVVGASVQDFGDLQQMYPQLMLIAVAVDDVPHAPALGQCQRVIGLREDVPAKTDEVLRHTFRNRYLRLTGGMARVREQLDAWLDKPGSTEPRRSKFNRQRNNKGSAEGQKKRHGNHPRKPGQ